MTRLAVLVFGLMLSNSAFAQTAEGDNGRYTMTQVGVDVLRLDTRTGQVSQCTKVTAGWTCTAVPDERAALEKEIARLQSELIDSRKRSADPKAQPPVAQKRDDLKLPSDAELDQVMSFVEKVWKRLIDMVQGMQKEVEKKT